MSGISQIMGNLVKSHSCSDHFVVLSSSSSFSWSWYTGSGSVKFVWNCENKVSFISLLLFWSNPFISCKHVHVYFLQYIYGQSSSASTPCSSERAYSIEIFVEIDTVAFTDDVCGTLTRSDSIAAVSELYVYLGADDDTGNAAEWNDLSVYAVPVPTSFPTSAPSYAPTSSPTPVPSILPTGVDTFHSKVTVLVTASSDIGGCTKTNAKEAFKGRLGGANALYDHTVRNFEVVVEPNGASVRLLL